MELGELGWVEKEWREDGVRYGCREREMGGSAKGGMVVR